MCFYLLKRKSRLEPAATAQFFLIASLCCKNPAIVLEFAASSSLYDDALTRAARGHPTARRLERGRRASSRSGGAAASSSFCDARRSPRLKTCPLNDNAT